MASLAVSWPLIASSIVSVLAMRSSSDGLVFVQGIDLVLVGLIEGVQIGKLVFGLLDEFLALGFEPFAANPLRLNFEFQLTSVLSFNAALLTLI